MSTPDKTITTPSPAATGPKAPIGALPLWLKVSIAAGVGAGTVAGGQKLATDSPVHFGVVGQAPAEASGWRCAPEGGIVGAPLVCRPEAGAPETDTKETK